IVRTLNWLTTACQPHSVRSIMKNGQKLNPHWGLFLSAVLRSLFGAGVFIEGWARLQFCFFRKRKAFAPKPASLPSCRHFACERDRGQFGCFEKRGIGCDIEDV